MCSDSEHKGSKRLPPRPRLRIIGAAGFNRFGTERVIDLLPKFDEHEQAVPDRWTGFAQWTQVGWRIPVFSTEQLKARASRYGWKLRILKPEN